MEAVMDTSDHSEQAADLSTSSAPPAEDQSDLSDQEDAEKLDLSPFTIDWFDLQFIGCDKKLAISELPGCRYRDTWRSLNHDIDCLKKEGIEDIFSFCTKGELYKYRTKKLFDKYSQAGFTVHQRPIEDGSVLELSSMVTLVEEIRVCLMAGRKTLIHCHRGLGRSCAVAACLVMAMDDSVNRDDVIKRLKDLRGPKAIYSVKQYNYVNDFEEKLKEFKQHKEQVRSVSR